MFFIFYLQDMVSRRALLKKYVNWQLISRFVAKQIDILLVQIVSFGIYVGALQQGKEFNALAIFVIALLVAVPVEATLLYWINYTPGKFFLGLRVYPASWLDSFKRSSYCYVRGLGLGLPLINWIVAAVAYGQGLHQGGIAWDKYGPVVQNKKQLWWGLITATGLIIIISLSLIKLSLSEQAQEAGPPAVTPVETVVIPYQEVDEELKTLWTIACQLGVVGLMQEEKVVPPEEFGAQTLAACEQSAAKYLKIDDDPTMVFMKACGYGIGLGSQLLPTLGRNLTQARKEELLKNICVDQVQEIIKDN